ncbi:MAG TPA: HAD family hydrolase [Thermoplasmata archaeon]|nr:HAD family hydrolase [Thermoplasmata archaeon]
MSDTEGAPRYVEPLLGIVFDLDGTLVLSYHDFGRMRGEVIRIAERHGVPPGHLHPSEPIARILDAARSELTAAGIPDGSIFRMEAEVQKTIDAIELEALPRTVPRPGAARLLRTLTDKGYRVGLLTRSSEVFCRAALQKTELLPYFGYLRTRSAEGPAKPSPEALLLLLKEMEVPRDRALFVGDHQMDAECAIGARVLFYGLLDEPLVEGGMSLEKFQNAGASAVAHSLDELGEMLGFPRAAAAIPH